MRARLRSTVAVLALAVVALGAPLSARAHHCDSKIVIFSDPVSLNANAGICAVDPTDEVADTRFILPGSDGVQVRYTVDLGASIPKITGFLDGMGFDHVKIDLNRADFNGLGFVYDSDVVMFPAGSAAIGCVTATVYDPEDVDFVEPLDVTTFHTIESTEIVGVTAGC